MKVISSQHYIDTEIVEAKIRALSDAEVSEITLTCWDAGEFDGEELVILSDGHHTYEAAKELGIAVKFEIELHPDHVTGEELLEVAYMDGDYYYEISYNTVTGEVTTREFVGYNGDSNYTQWLDGETQRMYATYRPQSPQEIADQIDYWLMVRDPKWIVN